MKKILYLCISMLLIMSFSYALTLKTDQSSYDKGEEIVLSGSCDNTIIHNIKAELGKITIFEKNVICSEGKFEFKYETSFLDPIGTWKITLFTFDNETGILMQIKPTHDSAFYRITFLSPANFEFKKGESVFISIELADSGTPVDDAEVLMYDALGRKINLKPEGNGIYDVNYSIPYNAATGDWDLIVTAQKQPNGTIYGGERKIETKITETLFNFEIIEPAKQTYEQSDSIPFKTKITYPNGAKLKKENVDIAELRIGNQKIPLEINSEEEFILSHSPRESGNQVFLLYVKDNAGNEGTKRVELVITCSITCLVKTYGLMAFVIILVLGVVSRLFYAKTKNALQLIQLKKDKEKTLDLIKNLQTEYFEKGIMPASSYKKNLANYKSKLIDLEEKIKQLEAKIEAGK